MLDFLIGNDILSALVAFGIVLIPAVIIHELGHFLAAKAVGITVLEFGIGFPPRAAKLFSWGETEFTLNWIPLGGFVRPLGEDFVKPVSEEETQVIRENITAGQTEVVSDVQLSERAELALRGIHDTKAVNEVRPGSRILFFVAGAFANFIAAILLFTTMGVLGIPEETGVRIRIVEVAPDSSFAEAGLQRDDFIESVNGQVFATERELLSYIQSNTGEVISLRAVRPTEDGEIETLELTLIPDANFTQAWLHPNAYVRVMGVSEGTPANEAGLLENDLILGVNSQTIVDDPDPVLRLQEAGQDFAGQEITLQIVRDGEQISLGVTPREDPPPGVGRIGIGIDVAYGNADLGMVYSEGLPQIEMVSQPIGEALSYGFDRTAGVFQLLAEFPSRLLQGNTEPGEARIISVVGVTQIGGELLQNSIEDNEPFVILQYIALISIALGVTNLLPIPALDGGRILFVIVEIVRGRPIPPEREGVVHLAGLIFLLSIAVIFIVNDLVNPLTDILP